MISRGPQWLFRLSLVPRAFLSTAVLSAFLLGSRYVFAGETLEVPSGCAIRAASDEDEPAVRPPAACDSVERSDDKDDPMSELEPFLESHFDLYRDSEGYKTLTASSALGATIGGYTFTLARDTVFASDSLGTERSQAQVLSVHKDFSEEFGIGGGLGTVASTHRTDLAWSFRTSADIGGASLEANISHDVLAASAEEIRSNIRQTDFGLNLSDKLTASLGSGIEFHHKLYSDGNSSNEFQFSPTYEFPLVASDLAFGYSFQYLGFARDTNHGYWAPQRVLSNDVSIAWTFDWIDTYGRVEASGGFGSARMSGINAGGPSSGWDGGAKLVFGFRPTRNSVVEYYWNGSGSAHWSSTSAGLSLTYTF